jgi:hypothetical protein
MTDRIRIRRIEELVLPDYIMQRKIDDYFEFVDDHYDVTFLPWIRYNAGQESLGDSYWTQYTDPSVVTAVVYNLDDYYLPSDFNRRMTNICERCDVVFGYQLPVDHAHQGMVPICYPNLYKGTAQGGQLDIPGEIDIMFWGDYVSGPKAVEEYPEDGTHYRPDILARIEALAHGRWRTDFRDVRFWYLDDETKQNAAFEFRDAMLNSKLCLSLYGRGYNTVRNTDVFAQHRTLLATDVSRHVLVPEPELWQSREIGYIFQDDLADLEPTLHDALSNAAERRRRAENGWSYFHRHCSQRAIIRTMYDALRRTLDGRS